MLSPLANRTYRRLFTAQVTALLGTGLATVALSLLAYDLAGRDAGGVLGVALALKMVAYVVVAPAVASRLARVPRRRLLVSLDLARAACVLAMPLVTEVWQVFVLIFVLNACSAGFTPTFQAAIPDVLPEEGDYTRALSLSRVAYELENLLSPALAGVALLLVGYDTLFALNGVAFLASAALVRSVAVPDGPRRRAPVLLGIRRYLAVPRLRGLLALSVGVAAGSAMVIVNTVVIARDELGRGESAVAVALGAAGAGSMVTALLLPRVLARVGERTTLLVGGALLPAGLALAAVVPSWGALPATWALLGVGLAAVQTPAGRLVHRSARGDDGSALFAAQFSLSHACWLLTYPVAGVLGAAIGMRPVAWVLAGLAAAALVVAVAVWREPAWGPVAVQS